MPASDQAGIMPATMPGGDSQSIDIVPHNPLRYLVRHGRRVAIGMVCLVVTNACAQSIPYLIKQTIDAIGTLKETHDTSTVTRWITWIVLLTVLQALIRVLSRVLIFHVGRDVEFELRRSLFTHLCRMDGGFYRRHRTGDLMSRLTNDLSAVRGLFGFGVLHLVNAAFAYAIALPLMLRIDASLTLLALAPYPLVLLCARAFARRIYRHTLDQQLALSTMTAAVQQDLAGIREVKGYQLEGWRSRSFTRTSSRYLREAIRVALWRGSLQPIVGVGIGASMVVTLWVGGSRVPESLSLGDLVALNLYLGLLTWPTLAIGWMLSVWQRGTAAWQRLRQLLLQQPTLAIDASASTEPRSGNRDVDREPLALRVERLDLELDGARVLEGISFCAAERSLCAIVGRVGSGKSTLVEALARLIAVPGGSVFLGQQDVTTLDVAAVRRLIAYAPQDAFLFSISLRDNVAYGVDADVDPAERDRRVLRAVAAAGLSDDIEQLPDGLDTMVGERGISLSGGQRQRVALARALAAGRPVLILDDSLSAVDAETEREILAGLSQFFGDVTAILVSHRLSALQHADQVVVLDQGRVAEIGAPAELLRRDGIYAQLYRRQALDDGLSGEAQRGPPG